MDVYSSLPSFKQGFFTATAGLLVYAVARVIYNVYFHPLAHFPGPRGAASTIWWLAYQEFCSRDSLSTLRHKLHEQYGDIVRIAPNELHFSKPSAFDDIYNSKNKWDKDYQFYRGFNTDEAFFSQPSYSESKHRRALVSNMFSKKAISEIQHLVQDQLDRFSAILKKNNAAGQSSDLFYGFQSLAADIITSFLFATCFDQLSFPGFQGDIVIGVEASTPAFMMGKYSVFFVWLVRYIPPSLLTLLAPSLKGLVIFRNALEGQVRSVLKNPNLLDDAPHRVIYNELLNPELNKGHPIPTFDRLADDARTLFGAGSQTTGTTLMIGAYNLLQNPEIKQRLVDEVRSVWPDLDQPPKYEVLEKLPFLTAVIKETLRVTVAVPGGLPRKVSPSGGEICGVKIPGGTTVSQSALFVQFSEEIFARAQEFIPDRWLQPDSKLDSHLVIFSRGVRSCLGINLAYCELYLSFATLFRRFDITLDPKKPADMSWMEHWTPIYHGERLHAYCVPRSD